MQHYPKIDSSSINDAYNLNQNNGMNQVKSNYFPKCWILYSYLTLDDVQMENIYDDEEEQKNQF